jgi:hypothetical protein
MLKDGKMHKEDNFISKPVNDFNKNDTVYMQKIINGFSYTFFLKFSHFIRGNVFGEIIEIQPNNTTSICYNKNYYQLGDLISGKISKCYTFKKGSGCRWFKKVGDNWVCK